MAGRRLRGLYAITQTQPSDSSGLLIQVEQALQGGARIIQYRDKSCDARRRLDEARALNMLCRQYGAALIINDDVELAMESAADGVHLGKDDAGLSLARARLGPKAIIGISCYNSLEPARAAARAGADYVAFGRFFPSQSKPGAVQAEPQLLRLARRELTLPLVAIGGITPENGGPLITAGADMLAVIQGVFGQPDIRQACERFQALFDPEETPT